MQCVKRSCCVWCDHSLDPFLDSPVHWVNPRQFGKLITALCREGADAVRRGRPWSLPLEDRVLLIAAYWGTNLTLRQLAPLFGVSKSAADRIIHHLGPSLALQQRKRFRKGTVLIVDGTLVPTRDHTIAEQSKNYRYSTNHQVVNVFDATTGAPIDLPSLGDVSIGPGIFKEWAGYADVTWHATSRLSVLVGARYTHDSTSYTQVGSGLLTGDSDFTIRSSDSPTTYLFNPSFKFNDDLMAYVRVASGFRPGGANVGVPPGLGAPLSFAPDKLTSYELGFKSTLLDRSMVFDADVFYIDWKQIQLTSTAGGFVFLGNGGKAKSQGVEANWKYEPARGLVLSANASWTDAALTADTPAGLYGYKGDRLPWVPKWNANVGVDYDFPLGGGWSGFVGASYRYVGTRMTDFLSVPGPRLAAPAYHGIDLHAGTYIGNWTIRGYIKNLTNARGITSLSSETIDPQGSPFAASYVPPRTVGVTVGLDF